VAFVLPGGDYESALRMAGASNFMEALESGVDRQMRRRAARQQIQQARDAYDRQKSLEASILLGEELSGVLGAGDATTTGSRRKGVAGLPGVSLEEALLQSVADSEENIALQGLARKRLAEEEAALAAIEATRADPGFTSEEIWYPQRAPAPAAEEAPRRRVRRRSGPAPVTPPAPAAPPAAVDEEWLRGLERAVEGWDPTGETVSEEDMRRRAAEMRTEEMGFEKEEADRLYTRGLELFGAGRYGEARQAFSDSNSLVPDEQARKNATLAYEKMSPGREERGDVSTSFPQMVGGISPVALGAAFGLGGAPEEEVSRPSQLGRALSRWTGQAVSAAEGAAEEFGVSPADKVSDDQLEDAISALTTGSSGEFLKGNIDTLARGSREKLQKFLPGIDELSSSRKFQRSTMKHALEELERRQETLSLAKPPKAATPDDTVELKDAGGTTHKVVAGDTVSGIANTYGSTVGAIVKANPSVFLDEGGKPRTLVKRGKVVLSGKDLIYPGEGLRIPTGEGAETGGEAGAVDSRKDAPKGTLAELLAKQGEKATTIEGLRAELQKLQDNQPETPVNPFQKFGRDIAYLPSLKAVAFATQRAQQGDFSMINQMAGRVVKNYELDGLFADYRDFVSGTRRKANEIYASRVLEQKTAEQEKKLGAINAATIMARTQFREAGYSEDEAQLFSSYYGDLYSENPEQARAWSTTLNQMGKDERAAERKRIRYGSSGGVRGSLSGGDLGPHKSFKDLMYAYDKARDDRREAAKNLAAAAGITEGMLLDKEVLNRVRETPEHQFLFKGYMDANRLYNELEADYMRARGYKVRPGGDDDAIPQSLEEQLVEGREDLADVAREYKDSQNWDEFKSNALRLGYSREVVEALTEEFKGKHPPEDPTRKRARDRLNRASRVAEDVLARSARGEEVETKDVEQAIAEVSEAQDFLKANRTSLLELAKEGVLGGPLMWPRIVGHERTQRSGVGVRGVPVGEDIQAMKDLERDLSKLLTE
jgi:LysM repeat protein